MSEAKNNVNEIRRRANALNCHQSH
ncbi:hypothetical protein [Bacteroides stercorirosoris]